MADVVVIGAGLGGLAAAVVLGARGLDVEVVEAADGPGGKAGVVTVDGVEMDTGPSVLTLPHVFDDVFREAGTTLAAHVTLRAPTPAFRYLWPDGVALDVHPTLDATVASVEAALGPRAARELTAFMTYAAGIWDAASPEFVFGPAPSLARLARLGPARLAAFTRIDPMRTMWGAIRSRVRSPHLRALLARYATYNGSDPRRAPATLNCIAHVELAMGGYGVEGGIFELVRALVRVAEEKGVRFHYGARVARVDVADRVRGVVLADGRTLPADRVVANADAGHLFDLLPGRTDRLPGSPPAAATPSTSGWTGLLRARRRERSPHTVLFPDDYEAEFTDLFDRDRPPEVPTVYVCAQEACHGRAGWSDHEPLFVMANAPAEPARGARDPATWPALSARVRERIATAGLVDDGDRLVWERDPSGLAARFPGSRGALYGAASNSMFSAFQRPDNRVAGVPGLYLASGSAHPGGGMPLCVQSGRLAAEAVLEDR